MIRFKFKSNTETSVSIQAQSVLAELNKSKYIRFPQQVGPGNRSAIHNQSDDTDEPTTEVETNVLVYPNPTQGDFKIEFSNAINGSAQIVDLTGKTIAYLRFTDSQNSYSITDLPTGLYTIVVNYTDGTLEAKRIIVE